MAMSESTAHPMSRPCPQTARRRSGRATRSPRRTSGSRVHLAWGSPAVRPPCRSACRCRRCLAVGGIGEAHSHLRGIVLRLAHALGQRLVPRLGLDDREFAVAIDEHVVGGCACAPTVAFDAARRDRIPRRTALLDTAAGTRSFPAVRTLGTHHSLRQHSTNTRSAISATFLGAANR